MGRVNKAIELLEKDQPIYYEGAHSGHSLTYEQGRLDSKTWADYINVGMEHGAFNLGGLEEYMKGLADAGPTKSGHRTPTILVEAPVDGSSEQNVRFNSWQFRQILGRGVHGILLCYAERPEAVSAFVESCRYPINMVGVGKGLNRGSRGTGSQLSSAPIWGVSEDEYVDICDPWPLNPNGELLLGVKIESVRAVSHIEQILAVPGIGFAEMGPGDMHMSYGIKRDPNTPLDERIADARERVRVACASNGVAFLSNVNLKSVEELIDEGARVISGASEEDAITGRKYTNRIMPV